MGTIIRGGWAVVAGVMAGACGHQDVGLGDGGSDDGDGGGYEDDVDDEGDDGGDGPEVPTPMGDVGECGDGAVDPGEVCDDGNNDDGDGCDAQCWPESDDPRPYAQAPFAATHNSYAGGDVGSLVEQLDDGVRFVELDVHTDDFGEQGYTVGHDSPGDEVMLGGGNPDSTQLPAWLDLIAAWSDEHDDHAPITVLIDFKDRPASQHHDDGNLAAFNEVLATTLTEARLFTPDALAELGAWPTVDELRGRVIVVLSGNEDAQLDYRRDRGDNPAIAINGLGQVVEVHQSDSHGDEMWLWTGQIQADGTIAWARHSKYDTGNHPAVALNDAGVLVEVHEDPDSFDDQLWYRVGRLDADLEVEWSTDKGQPFPGGDNGVAPSVAFTSLASNTVREVHQSENDGQHWYWLGEDVDLATGTIPWARPDGDGTTGDEQYAIDAAEHGGTAYTVTAGDDAGLTQVLTVHGATTHRVRYAQLAFGSARHNSKSELLGDGLVFFGDDGSSSAGREFISERNAAGAVTRLWKFELPKLTEDTVPINFGATDEPRADWYVQYCAAVLCAR